MSGQVPNSGSIQVLTSGSANASVLTSGSGLSSGSGLTAGSGLNSDHVQSITPSNADEQRHTQSERTRNPI